MSKKNAKEFLTVYSVGAAGYSCVELLWRGFTHWTMTLTGGLCFWLIYNTCKKHREWSLWKKCLAGCAQITVTEFVVGCIVNRWLNWDVWDYSDMPFHILGQICAVYSILWFLLCIPVVKLSTMLQKKLTHSS